jgi:hypothetical protein
MSETCQTCKHWSRNANLIGAGNCLNAEMHMRLYIPNAQGWCMTAQNFGCPCHEPGECTAKVYSEDEEATRLTAFLSRCKRA